MLYKINRVKLILISYGDSLMQQVLLFYVPYI